jgi:tRNA(Ile)-lysidine synthase
MNSQAAHTPILFQKILDFSNKHRLIAEHTTIVIGLSGGPDSTFLLHFLAQLRTEKKLTLIAAHLDHQWRSSAADDQLRCKQKAEALGITFVTAQAQDLAIKVKADGSQEAVGRKLRRFFLEQVAAQYHASAIALAHHRQDQEETFFIRLIRGTTLSGLCAMHPKNGIYMRPLLETNKEELVNYLHENGIAYCTDPTNSSLSYLRNRIRRSLPALATCDQRFHNNFLRTLHSLHDTEHFLEQLTHTTFNAIMVYQHENYWLLLEQFFSLHDYLQKRIVMHWLITANAPFVPTDQLLNEIIRFLKQPQDKIHTVYTRWSVKKRQGFAALIVGKQGETASEIA